MSNVERNDSAADFFEEAARILDADHVPPVNTSTLPNASKTPTTTEREAKLAAAVDGGNRVLCIDGMPGQGLHVIPPNNADDQDQDRCVLLILMQFICFQFEEVKYSHLYDFKHVNVSMDMGMWVELWVEPYMIPALEHAQSTLGPTGNAHVGFSRPIQQAGVFQKTPLHPVGFWYQNQRH